MPPHAQPCQLQGKLNSVTPHVNGIAHIQMLQRILTSTIGFNGANYLFFIKSTSCIQALLCSRIIESSIALHSQYALKKMTDIPVLASFLLVYFIHTKGKYTIRILNKLHSNISCFRLLQLNVCYFYLYREIVFPRPK